MAHMLMGNEMQQEKRPEYSYGRRAAAEHASMLHMHRVGTAPEPLQDPHHSYASSQRLQSPYLPPPKAMLQQPASVQDAWEAGCRHGAAEQRLDQREHPTLDDLMPPLPPQQQHQQHLPFHVASAAAAGRPTLPPQWQQDVSHYKSRAAGHLPGGIPDSRLRNQSMDSDSTYAGSFSPSVSTHNTYELPGQ